MNLVMKMSERKISVEFDNDELNEFISRINGEFCAELQYYFDNEQYEDEGHLLKIKGYIKSFSDFLLQFKEQIPDLMGDWDSIQKIKNGVLAIDKISFVSLSKHFDKEYYDFKPGIEPIIIIEKKQIRLKFDESFLERLHYMIEDDVAYYQREKLEKYVSYNKRILEQLRE